jgi:hypothetical protein
MNENQLVTIVQSSGLEKTKAAVILQKFTERRLNNAAD